MINNHNVLSYLIGIIKPFPVSIGVMTTFSIIWALNLSVKPYLLKIIIDKIVNSTSQDIFISVNFFIFLYFISMLCDPIISKFHRYFKNIKMIPNIRRTIAISSFNKLLKQSYSYYQNDFSGSLTGKINDLTSSVPKIISALFDDFFKHILALIIAIIALWNVNYIFAICLSVWSTLILIFSITFSKKLSILAKNWSELGSQITGKIVDSLSNILSIQLFSNQTVELDILSRTLNKAVKEENKLEWFSFGVATCINYSFLILQVLSIYFLIMGYQENWITIGDFIIVNSINFSIVDILGKLTNDCSDFSKLWGKVAQALQTIQKIPEMQDKDEALELRVIGGTIKFDKVNFNYNGANTLFKQKSITIKSGQKVGLVGYSGGGKSTFVSLILGLFDVTSGKVLIDGQNIKNIKRDSLRRNIAMIPQEPVLFYRSLMENIRYGRIDATDFEVIEAAKKASAHEFITNLPLGYESLIGERGVKLSGGQRQRIAIARAILKQAPILILDEATSQLDSITETDIQETLWHIMNKKTTIVIAHRLSTLLKMDRILVFDQGRVIGDGSHTELLHSNDLYQKLWKKQISSFGKE